MPDPGAETTTHSSRPFLALHASPTRQPTRPGMRAARRGSSSLERVNMSVPKVDVPDWRITHGH